MNYKIKPGSVKPIQHPHIDIFKDKKVVVQCEVILNDEQNEKEDIVGLSSRMIFQMNLDGNDTFDSIQQKAEQQAEIELNNALVEKQKAKEKKEKGKEQKEEKKKEEPGN